MITSTNSATSTNSSTDFTVTLPATSASTAGSTDPFGQELASAIEQYLGKSGNGAPSQVNISIAQSQVSDGSQFTVTINEPGATGAPIAAGAPAATPAALNDPLMASSPAAIAFAAAQATTAAATSTPTTYNEPLMASSPAAIAFAAASAASTAANSAVGTTTTAVSGKAASATPLGTISGTTASGTTAAATTASTNAALLSLPSPVTVSAADTAAPPTIDKSNMTPDQAYWAEQPAAVQALQNLPADQRAAAAQTLAQQGYTIDVPIMVWGWDPLTTMIERQQYGYTWVPSGLQSPVELAPGLSFPETPYDGSNPPPGSIAVTTDFAKGTNMQNVFIDPATIQASFTDTNFGTASGNPSLSNSGTGSQGVVARNRRPRARFGAHPADGQRRTTVRVALGAGSKAG